MRSGTGQIKTIALAGNPNTGKSTLFNALTGLNAKVGNYPGITVDKRSGNLKLASHTYRVMDIPGTYSLNARSKEEELAIRAVIGADEAAPDLVIVVVDATLLERNLYLVLQLQELGLPLMVAVNMMDSAANLGLKIDLAALSEALGVPAIGISATKASTLVDLKAAIEKHFEGQPPKSTPTPAHQKWQPSADLQALIEAAAQKVDFSAHDTINTEALCLWALMSADGDDPLALLSDKTRIDLLSLREAYHKQGHDLDVEVSSARYAWIDRIVERVVHHPERKITWTERADALFTHPIIGFAIFAALMMMVFSSLFSWADPAIGLVEDIFGQMGEFTAGLLGEGLFTDFIVDGVIAGVGSVLVFLPQILLLFFFIILMEASGYMARAAFLMDRIMNAIGLHGRAFVPMLSGYACAIPAIMATRTMERERDRMLTMMVVPLMSCSARLPVYTLMIAVLFPPESQIGPFATAPLMMVAMYIFSTVMALVAAAVLGRTVLKGERVPLLLELPPYRIPNPKYVLRALYERSRVFVTEAGTVILVCTIVLWGLLSFPQGMELPEDAPPAQIAQVEGQNLAQSYGGQMGQVFEPILEPLGFDWKIGVGLIGAFAAREVFVSTMGVIYGVGGDADEESPTLREALQAEKKKDGSPQFSFLTGLSLMVFIALACQCMSTLAVIKRETGGYKWPAFVFAYMSAMAYVSSFLVYQGGLLLGFS